MARPYSYTRYKWYDPVDLQQLEETLRDRFSVEKRPMPFSEQDVSIYRYERDGIKVKADTLSAFLYLFKAVLFQLKAQPFTMLDRELREAVLSHYTRDRSGVLATGVVSEPPFESG